MDKKTITTYNKTALEYDEEISTFWDRFPRTFIDKFAQLAKEKVLDIGSGPGRDGMILKEKGLDITCLDASFGSHRQALPRERIKSNSWGDFNKLPFENETFDAVWAYTSLLHVPKAEVDKPIDEIKRVLKDKGILGHGLIEGDTEEYKESSGVNMPRWFSFYKKDEIESILKNHGFEQLYFEEFKPGSKNYLNFIYRKK